MPSLADRLKSLGVNVGAANLKPAPAKKQSLAEEILEGNVFETPMGETFRVERQFVKPAFSQLSQHNSENSLSGLAQWANLPALSSVPLEEFTFLDTETTGLSGGSGTYAFLIGVGRFQGNEFQLTQFFMRDPSEESAILYALEDYLCSTQAIVTFNGKSFDAPLINTRFTINGQLSPLSEKYHVDILHLARKLWRDRIPNRALANLEIQILGAKRTEQDIPGWMIPQIYFDYLHTGDVSSVVNVLYHNAMDVLSLAELFLHVSQILADPFSPTIESTIDRIALARLFEDLKDYDKAVELYLNALSPNSNPINLEESDPELPQNLLFQAIIRLAQIYKKQNNYPQAINLWKKAASYHQLDACIELAKYYEHQDRNYSEALSWTNLAIDIITQRSTSLERAHRLLEIEYRHNRLNKRIHGSSNSTNSME